MELGIIGHTTRGDEVIKILEMLGGKNCCYRLTGYNDKYFYYISYEYKYISNSYIGPDEIKGYKIFSLDEFLEKFPYKVGDKVTLDNKLCSIIWMCWECNNIYYQVQGEDLMFTKKVIANELKPYKEKNINMNIEYDSVNDEEQQIDYVEVVKKSYEEEAGKRVAEITMDTLYKAWTTHDFLKERGFNLPEGFHFTDENGNVIEAKKILLVKNAPSYPKSYDECCDVIGISRHEVEIDIPQPYQQNMFNLFKLLICRDAYWKIAGEYLELDKPWEPDWNWCEYKFCIGTIHDEIEKFHAGNQNCILAFPTEEMRDEFHNNFKNLIEQCKELL